VAIPAKDVIAIARKSKTVSICLDDIAVNVSSTRQMAKDFPGWRTAADRGDGRLPQLWRCYYEQRLHGRAAHGVRPLQRAHERAGRVHGGAPGGAGAAGCTFSGG
jgi:hypothetical protein